MKAAYLVSAEHAIELSNVFATLALMFFGIASIVTGLVMLKGVFSKGVGYLVIIAGTLTLLGAIGVLFEPLALFVLFGLTLSGVWQIVVGIRLYKLGGLK